MNSVFSIRRLSLIKNQLKSFTSKGSETINNKLRYKFNSGFIKIPHFSKKEKGGEDALAIDDGLICVADGVGGWADQGVDPGIYSNQLAQNVKKYFLEETHNSIKDPTKFFVKACLNTKVIGSSTCCLIVFDLEKNHIHTLNLGDSGYMLLRPIKNPENDSLSAYILKMIYKSEEQTHEFNFPFQVGTGGDNPESAIKMIHEFKENDIIVLATDGLWDNLYESQILGILNAFVSKSNVIANPEEVAEMIALTAEQFSLNQRYKSPFAIRSQGLFNGGKSDDITIIVSQIINNI